VPIATLRGVELYYEETGEPDLFNRHVAEFLAAVEQGRWAGWVR
jgi:hypothetical protein